MSSPFTTSSLRGPLPPGRHRIAREEVLASQRGRMLEACAETVAESGYPAATIGQIVSRAQVSRRTFYEHFASKQECFLATYDAGQEIMRRVTGQAMADAGDDWRAQVSAGVTAYLELLAREPAFTRTMVLEVLAAGPEALERRRRLQQSTADVFRHVREAAGDAPPLPELAYRAIVGGISEVVADRVAAGEIDAVPGLAEPLAAWVLRSLS